jgi:large subunit ribosomal protein L25
MEKIVIPAQSREVAGTRGATAARREGFIPAVIYGGKEPVTVNVRLHDVRHAIYSPDFHRVKVQLDGEDIPCILREVQYHPITDDVIHIDFLRLVDGTKVKVEVPVKFTGQSIGLKAGGKLIQKLRRIKIKATPDHLVDEITLDVTNLELGQSVRIRDVQLGDHVEILNSPGIPVASVGIPRALKGPEETAPAAATAEATPEAAAATGDAAKKAPAGDAAKKAPAAEPAKKAEGGKK